MVIQLNENAFIFISGKGFILQSLTLLTINQPRVFWPIFVTPPPLPDFSGHFALTAFPVAQEMALHVNVRFQQ